MPRVLIVDDEPGIRFALKRWFERQQWVVIEAQDGQVALEIVQASGSATVEDDAAPFDVVVCDLHLPGLSGAQLVTKLREEQPALANRVILTTGDDVSDADPTSVLATHPHVLQKPFDLGMLRAAVERVTAA